MTDELLKAIESTPVEYWTKRPEKAGRCVKALYEGGRAEPDKERSDRMFRACAVVIAVQHAARRPWTVVPETAVAS